MEQPVVESLGPLEWSLFLICTILPDVFLFIAVVWPQVGWIVVPAFVAIVAVSFVMHSLIVWLSFASWERITRAGVLWWLIVALVSSCFPFVASAIAQSRWSRGLYIGSDVDWAEAGAMFSLCLSVKVCEMVVCGGALVWHGKRPKSAPILPIRTTNTSQAAIARDILHVVEHGRGLRVVSVVGPIGVGKTHLVDTILQSTRMPYVDLQLPASRSLEFISDPELRRNSEWDMGKFGALSSSQWKKWKNRGDLQKAYEELFVDQRGILVVRGASSGEQVVGVLPPAKWDWCVIVLSHVPLSIDLPKGEYSTPTPRAMARTLECRLSRQTAAISAKMVQEVVGKTATEKEVERIARELGDGGTPWSLLTAGRVFAHWKARGKTTADFFSFVSQYADAAHGSLGAARAAYDSCSSLAARVFRCFSVFPPHVAIHVQEIAAVVMCSMAKAERAIKELESVHLILPTSNDAFRLHAMVIRFLQTPGLWEDEEQMLWSNRYVEYVARAFTHGIPNERTSEYLLHVWWWLNDLCDEEYVGESHRVFPTAHVCRREWMTLAVDAVGTVEWMERWLTFDEQTHLYRALLTRCEEGKDDRARLLFLSALGNAEYERLELDRALTAFAACEKLAAQRKDDDKVAQAVTNAAAVLQRMHRYTDAKVFFLHALGMRKQSMGQKDVCLAPLYHDLGELASVCGEAKEAKKWWQRAVGVKGRPRKREETAMELARRKLEWMEEK